MKRFWIIIVNVFIMIAMLVFVAIYSYNENKNLTNRQIEHFKDTTITMEKVTENYLEGEQRICDVWAQYIDNNDLTIEDAISFIRESHVLEETSAHIIYLDGKFEGLSTKAAKKDGTDYYASYKNIDLLTDTSWIHSIGDSINVSRAYTNPVNGEQSIAFCNFIKINKDGNKVDAVLLRILPINELKNKWVFPQEEFENAELSIIDSKGDYIIKGHSFKNSSFFEFYKSYNNVEATSVDSFFKKITTTTDTLKMNNSHKEECILAHTQFEVTGGWTLLSLMPMKSLISNTQNWLLIGFVSIGLVLLFVFDLAFMIYFNNRLKETAKEADSANKAKTDFLSTMSHDIRTPMNAIIGFTTIAKNNIDDKKSVDESLHKIDLASNHLLTLINDILDISKVESGKLNLCPQSFSIVDTVENLMNISQSMIKEKNIDFSFYANDIKEEYFYADQLRLNQIFINILSNALKYTEPGGKVCVNMKEEDSPKSECVRLTYEVSDTGIGMSPEFMQNMYQPFSRQTDSRVNSIQGTGLGLAITKQMVDLMEGTIECESEEGKGTKFKVVLDIPISNQQRNELKLDSMNVLLLDDDLSLINDKNILESLGLNVFIAKDYNDLSSKINDNNYGLIILNLNNKDDDSINNLKNIKLKSVNTPVLLISKYDLSDNENIIKEIGAKGFLRKPIFKSTIYDKINDILGINKSIKQENDYSDLEGLNILVAEDHDINWEIINALLEMHGIKAERATNGRVCIDMLKNAPKGKYALIFMDIQMPEMNGLDATREIRKLDDKDLASIPIIAMTADAFAENVTECLNAGMNGHIAKPVDINLVIKEIRRIKEESKR